MAWQVAFDAPRRIVSVTYAGDVSGEEVRACVQKCIDLMRAEDTNLVYTEVGDVNRMDLSTTDVVGLPERYRTLGLRGPFRQAIVAPAGSGAFDVVAFYETVCLNRGHQVRLFPDRERALAWLLAAP